MAVTLSVKVTGHKVSFGGSVKPSRVARYVLVQRLVGASWVTLAKAKVSWRSTYSVAKVLATGAYDLRALTASTKRFWGAESAVRHLVVP